MSIKVLNDTQKSGILHHLVKKLVDSLVPYQSALEIDPLLCLRPGADAAPSKAPLLAIFAELDTPEGVKAIVSANRRMLDQAGCRDYTVKVYPNGSVFFAITGFKIYIIENAE